MNSRSLTASVFSPELQKRVYRGMREDLRLPLPTLAIVGYGRAGKDTACEWFRDNTALRFEGGCSWAGRHYMASLLGVTPDVAYAGRHTQRNHWREELDKFRREDPTKLVRLVLETSDIVCGIRGMEELTSSRDQGLLDLIIWIDNDRVAKDDTVDFSKDDCDIVVENNGSLEAFYRKLSRLSSALKLQIV